MPAWTAETARLMAKRSHAPTSARHLPARILADNPQYPAIPAQPDPFTAQRLDRIKAALCRLELRMIRCCHSKTMKELASAYAVLAEVERQLAGRPMPGSLRPTGKAARADAGAWTAEPLEIAAQVQEQPTATPAPPTQG